MNRPCLPAAFLLIMGLLMISADAVCAAQPRFEVRDLAKRLVALAGREPAVIQFEVHAADSGQFLLVECKEPFAVFREGMVLVSSVEKVRWSVDSIGRIYGMPLTIAVVRQKPEPLSVQFLVPVPEDPMDPGRRVRSRYTEFAVLGGLLVVVYLFLMMASSMRNLSEYLRFMRTFSTSGREGRPADAGLTSTASLIAYAFFVLLVAYTLTLYLDPPAVPQAFADLVLAWLKRVLIVAAFVVGKLVMVSFFSFLFRLAEAAAVQVTAMIRSGILLCLLLMLVMIPVGWYGAGSVETSRILTWVWLLVQSIHTFTLYMKLKGVTGARPFHLFSYLCISELIPLVFLVTTL